MWHGRAIRRASSVESPPGTGAGVGVGLGGGRWGGRRGGLRSGLRGGLRGGRRGGLRSRRPRLDRHGAARGLIERVRAVDVLERIGGPGIRPTIVPVTRIPIRPLSFTVPPSSRPRRSCVGLDKRRSAAGDVPRPAAGACTMEVDTMSIAAGTLTRTHPICRRRRSAGVRHGHDDRDRVTCIEPSDSS